MNNPHPADSSTDPAIQRGERAHTRLLGEASRIFAEKGYAKSSTREICEAAQLNPAAIHYHFGDKEGLYRAVLLVPIEGIAGALAGFDEAGLPLTESLRRLLAPFVGEGGGGGCSPGSDHGVRLYLREMLEPTPVFAAAAAQHLAPMHERIARLVARHIGLAGPDEDVHRLVFALIAMAHDYCMSRQFMQAVAPSLLDGSDALSRARERLVEWGTALVVHERRRRGLENEP
jgi:AcrR family transcriptional regulator